MVKLDNVSIHGVVNASSEPTADRSGYFSPSQWMNETIVACRTIELLIWFLIAQDYSSNAGSCDHTKVIRLEARI